MQNIAYYQINSNSKYAPLSSNWAQPNLLRATVDNDAPTFLLWKESYDSNWQITTNPENANITYFYAGSGVMLICIPAGVNTVQFFMPLSQVDDIGIIISVTALLALAVVVTLRKHLSKL